MGTHEKPKFVLKSRKSHTIKTSIDFLPHSPTQFIGSSLLCTLAIMLYSDLAFPAVMCCFGWIFSRISLPQHLQQQHSAAKGHDFCYRPSQPQRQQKTRRNCASVSDHPPLINDIASFAHHLQQLKRGPRVLRCRSE
jgi:hypothetical protein